MQARTYPVAAEQANSMNAADRTHFPLGCQAMPGLLFRCRRGLAQALGTGQTLHKSKRFAAAFLILTVSFSIKSLHAVDLSRVMHTKHQPGYGISLEYDRDAASTMAGRGLFKPDNWDPEDTRLLDHAPGYSIFLAAIYSWFGRSYFHVQLIQNLI